MKSTKGFFGTLLERSAVLLVLLVLMSLTAGCASPPPPVPAPQPSAPAPEPPPPPVPLSEPAPVEEHRWTHRIFITDPGTRHQGEMGYLYYNDDLVQGWFDAMLVGNRRYLFHDRMLTWQAGGYLPDGKYRPQAPALTGAVTDEDLLQGWYPSAALRRKDGTPDFWVHISREHLAAWIDPREMADFADAHGIRPITRVEPIDLFGQAVEKKE